VLDSLAAAAPSWQAWARAHGASIQWHGIAPQIHRSGQSIRQMAAESLPSMAMLIAGLIAIRFRDFHAAAIGAWMCVLPVAALVITAAAAGWQLGPCTLMIGSITAGVAVDDTLHLLTASARHRSLCRGIIECWKPCVGSSLAAAACFSLFMLSPFQPTRQFGLLMALATCFAMLANQIVLPASLALLQATAASSAKPKHPHFLPETRVSDVGR
jgi:predicted RND superfamily exporter protein